MLGYAAELKPWTIPGNTVYLDKARGYAFCESEAVMGAPPNLVVQVYNTSGQQECSPAQFDPIDPKALASIIGLANVTDRLFWVNRHNSLKLYASRGVSTCTGGDFDIAGIAWQYRWGGGL